MEIQLKVLGDTHPDIARFYHNLAYTLVKLGDHHKALEFETKAIEIAEKALGKEHPNTQRFLGFLNLIKAEMKKHEMDK